MNTKQLKYESRSEEAVESLHSEIHERSGEDRRPMDPFLV